MIKSSLFGIVKEFSNFILSSGTCIHCRSYCILKAAMVSWLLKALEYIYRLYVISDYLKRC